MTPPRKYIAIVEDDESVRRGFERVLRLAGFNCQSFGCAEEFLAGPALDSADCLVSDIQLSTLSGIQLALHPSVTARNLPVVLVTGSDDPMLEIPAREFGAAFLRKPVRSAELLEIIIDIVGPPISDGDD